MPIRVALVYDFDGTLAPGAMQGHGLLKELGHEFEADFWKRGKEIAKAQDA